MKCAPYLYHPHASPLGGAAALTPMQVAAAYQLPKVGPVPTVKLGIGSLGGAVSAADVQMAFARWGLHPPVVRMLSVRGAIQSPDPAGADVENMLDVLVQAAVWAYCAGTPADVTVCSAPNDDNGIGDATKALADAGCQVMSWSWGAPESGWSPTARAYTEAAFAYAASRGMWVTAASGDNSEDDGTPMPSVDYPCGSAAVLAVGGTRLLTNADGSLASESAWGDGRAMSEGGGGGFDRRTPKPSYQSAIAGAWRGAPDCSANADPATGYQIVSGGRWMTVGGTSGAAPFMAAWLAVCRAAMQAKNLPVPALPHGMLYANPQAFRDVTSGSNGFMAATGWDAATGLGSPNGPVMLAVLAGSNPPVPVPPTPPAPPSPPPPPPPPAVTLPQVLAWLDAETRFLQARNPGLYALLGQIGKAYDSSIITHWPQGAHALRTLPR